MRNPTIQTGNYSYFYDKTKSMFAYKLLHGVDNIHRQQNRCKNPIVVYRQSTMLKSLNL